VHLSTYIDRRDLTPVCVEAANDVGAYSVRVQRNELVGCFDANGPDI